MDEIKIYDIYETDRYGKSKAFGEYVICIGTLKQALELAKFMSYKFAGQEGQWLVSGYEDE